MISKTAKGFRLGLATALAAASSLGIASPSLAAETVLTFDGFACTGRDSSGNGGNVDRNCVDSGNLIGADYGSSAQLAVSYNGADIASVGGASITNLQYASYGSFAPGGAAAAIVPIGTADEAFSRIFFTPASGFEVSLRSFEYSNVSFNTLVFLADILDENNNTIFSYAAPTGVGSNLIKVSPNTGYFSGPLTFRFQSASGSAGIDNFTFDVRGIASGGVPEPATWALMILGIGAVGGALRRRRHNPTLRLA